MTDTMTEDIKRDDAWIVGDSEPPSDAFGTIGTAVLHLPAENAFQKIQIHGNDRDDLAAQICAFLNDRDALSAENTRLRAQVEAADALAGAIKSYFDVEDGLADVSRALSAYYATKAKKDG